MSRHDGEVSILNDTTVITDADGNPTNSLNTILGSQEFSGYGSSVDSCELHVKTPFRNGGTDSEMDNSNSLGTNIEPHSHSYADSHMNDGNMDVQTPEPVMDESDISYPVASGNVHEQNERCISYPSVIGSVTTKSTVENVEPVHRSSNDYSLCDVTKSSDGLKPVKNTKQFASSCRSSIQDVQDSCLRMDVLPNVSPDSGIVSFQGSPFGNESPYSAAGCENGQDMNPSHSNSLVVHKNSRDSEMVKLTKSTIVTGNTEKGKGEIIGLKEQSTVSDIFNEAVSNVINDSVSNTEVDGNVMHPEESILDAQSVGGDNGHENVKHQSREEDVSSVTTCVTEKSKSMTSDIILSSPTKISTPSWKKKKSNSVKRKKLQIDHKRSVLYSNTNLGKAADNERICEMGPEKSGNMNEFLSDTNDNNVKPIQMVSDTKMCNVVSAGMFDVDVLMKRKSPGRQKGSSTKEFDFDHPRRTYRKPVQKILPGENLETAVKHIKEHSSNEKPKRPRGRPRKDLSCEQPSPVKKSNPAKLSKKKKGRKRVFTRLKKTNGNKLAACDNDERPLERQDLSDHSNVDDLIQPPLKKSNTSLQQSPPNFFVDTSTSVLCLNEKLPPQKCKETFQQTRILAGDEKLEKSEFSDLEALLKSVKSSISSQFKSEKESEEVVSSLTFDNPFRSMKTPSFDQVGRRSNEMSPIKVKPKYKKPKLHVMMRKTKRKKRKKKFESSRLSGGVSSGVSGSFGASSPQKRLSFFSSHVQPSKLLASSRLNVFQTGTGVESNRSGTPTDGEQTEGSEKRMKKRRKLLNFKSKHKNIIDPVFAADIDILEGGVKSMAISENPTDNFIRVRPGEMPLPSIFRVIKIDLMKKMKEKIPDVCTFDSSKPIKSSRKDLPVSDISFSVKNACKAMRKKSLYDQASSSKDQTSLSDSSDQWLPPKKRHRMVNMDSILSQSLPSNSFSPSALISKDFTVSDKRKGRRQKRIEGDTFSKLDSHQSIDQVLTIDTSSYSTAGSSVSTLTPSPCPSRHSTRSSTLPSGSSLSPTDSTGFQIKHHSRIIGASTCPNHTSSVTNADDILSCAECQLLRRSASMAHITQSNYSLPRSLSNHSVNFNLSFDNQISSAESSPGLKVIKTVDEFNRRSARKRRKSSNIAGEPTESSPPRLEKHSVLVPFTCTNDVYSAPPPISPIKKYPSPHRQFGKKQPSGSSVVYTFGPPSNKKSTEGSSLSHRPLRSPPFRSTDKQLCNTPDSLSHLSASPSVILVLPTSDWQPLPLEHCKKKDVVGEIQSALQSFSSDDSSSDCDEEEKQYPSTMSRDVPAGQPPRKRYQRVGLFSDFYKDNEPKKRCENMVRCRDKLIYVKEEHEHGLMPLPIHVGYYYMSSIQDFQLPYDIWWQDFNHQLPKKSKAKIKFRNIRSNVYVDGKANCRKKEIPACICKHPPNGGIGCLDDCLNRLIYTECSMLNCPLGDNCGNQRIQKHDWAPGIEKFLTDDRGFGVRVIKPVKTGQFILEYLGEVVSETEFRRRMMEEYSEECHHYALHLDSGNVIDGYRMGNIGRYVNHSCQPNCEMQKWNVNGLYRMVLFALRDIEAFEELGYDYNFDAFNQETQQECRCGNSECRGVIGGKAQRTNGIHKQEKMSDESKDKRKSKILSKKAREKKHMVENVPVLPPMRLMTQKERCYARKHCMFLVRNVDKVLNQRHPGQVLPPIAKEEAGVGKVNCVTSDVLLANLTESSVKTRLATFAKDNPEVLRRHQLAQLFDKMLTELLSLKDKDGNSLVTPLMSLPSRKKQPQYYQVVKEPIDMSVIKQRVKTGHYDHLKAFNADVMLLFKNVELYCGPKSDMGQVILKLRQIFNCVMQDLLTQIDEILGPGTTKACLDLGMEKMVETCAKANKEPDEDIIRCICGVTRDEGLMLQCEKCLRWQHCDCVRASGKEEHYLCDRCEPRYYDPEILLAPPLPDSLPDCTHYMTLLKDDVQYAVGDCVYVMRDCKRSATGTPLRSSHRLIATSNPDSLDIFRIEQLWKDPKEERFASGTPYLRPQETFHEPTRKFLHNELFRTPNYEIIPLDLVMGKCVVMDPNTYCKGRPKGVKEQDVYVCEYRVDKTAHLFYKIKEIWYPLNTSRFCFDQFETKLTLKRTYTPHEIPEEYRRKAERNSNSSNNTKGTGKVSVTEEKPDTKKVAGKNHQLIHSKVKMDESLKHDIKLKAEVKVNVKKGSDFKSEIKLEACTVKPNVKKLMEAKRQEKRERLDKFCLKLLNNIPGKQKVDLSYLLDGGRRVRKKLIN